MSRLLRKYCFLIGLFLCATSSMANENTKNSMGVYLGGYFNLFGSNNGYVPSYYEKTTYEHLPSIIAGGYYERKLNRILTLQTGVYYLRCKIDNAYSVPDEDIHESTWGLTAIHFPINLNISILANQFYLISGFDFGLLLSAEIEGVGYRYPERFKYNIIDDMPLLDRSIVFGIGNEKMIQDMIFKIEIEYLYMLNNYTSYGITVDKKHNILFLVGFAF